MCAFSIVTFLIDNDFKWKRKEKEYNSFGIHKFLYAHGTQNNRNINNDIIIISLRRVHFKHNSTHTLSES